MAVDIQLDQRDLGRVIEQMRRAERELGMAPADALLWGARSVASTLGTSCRVAPKLRNYREITKSEKTSPDGRQPYLVETYSQGRGRRMRFVLAWTERELKQDKRVKIRMRGLAKAAWGYGLRRLGKTVSQNATGVAAISAQRAMDVIKKLTGLDQSITFRNRLAYAIQAFKASGDQTISTAFARAAKLMEKQIDGKLRKAAG